MIESFFFETTLMTIDSMNFFDVDKKELIKNISPHIYEGKRSQPISCLQKQHNYF